MESVYVRDTWASKGVQIEYKSKVDLLQFSKKVMKFANRNDITTISNWIGVVFGAVGLIVMVVF